MHNWTYLYVALCKHTAHSNVNALTDEYNRIKNVECLFATSVCICTFVLLFMLFAFLHCISAFAREFSFNRLARDGNVRCPMHINPRKTKQMHKNRRETNRPIDQKYYPRVHFVENVQQLRQPGVVHQTIHCRSSKKIRLRFDSPSFAMHT